MNGEPEKKKDVLRETDAEAIALARRLIRIARYGALAVLDPASGAPLASRTAVATDFNGSPLILVSALSAHTGGLIGDPRCSLLLGEPGRGDPLAHPRISLACLAERLERGTPDQIQAEARYLSRHPKATLYADFGDFSYFRLAPASASLNGGFGRAYHLSAGDLACPVPDGFAGVEKGAVAHMNADHADAIAVYARHFAGLSPQDAERRWLMTGIDPDGFDLAAGDHVARVDFPARLGSAGELRPALVALAHRGREA